MKKKMKMMKSLLMMTMNTSSYQTYAKVLQIFRRFAGRGRGAVEQELRVPKETAPPCEPGVDVEQRRNVHPCI